MNVFGGCWKILIILCVFFILTSAGCVTQPAENTSSSVTITEKIREESTPQYIGGHQYWIKIDPIDDFQTASPFSVNGTTKFNNRSIPLEVPDGLDEKMPRAILNRRSARSYTGAPIALSALGKALGFALGRGTPVRSIRFGTRDAGLLRCHLVAFSVDGLDPGLYAIEGAGEALLPLSLGGFREDFFRLSLGQEIAHTCAAVLAFSAPAQASVDRYGDRAYRYLHIEAGAVGERFQLAAAALGLMACGVGGFFDDEAARLLEIGAEDFVLYLVTIGRA